MARHLVSYADFDRVGSVDANPEILMMLAEGDVNEADATESLWLSGLSVTTQPSNDN